MRKIYLILFSSLVLLTAAAQNPKADFLVNKIWVIQGDEMSGVGVHSSLQKNTELQFLADGTWKSTQPIKNASSGKWKLENDNRNLVISAGSEETSYLILQLTEKELQYRLKKNAATYTYKWRSKE